MTERSDEEDSLDSDMDDEKVKRFSKFNFSGKSFKDYIGDVCQSQRNIKGEMVSLVQNFT